MVNMEKIVAFGKDVVQLTSFPTFCVYIAMTILSKQWQRHTKPLSLRPVLVVYNFACSCISVVTFVGFLYGLSVSRYVYQKEEVPALKPFYYLYWITKNIELMDTVIMILRHKSRQISFLHVYHHASMVLLSDYAYHYSAWPAIAPILALNSLVHIVLYLYYGLTALYPDSPLPWKRRLTEMQIFQFFLDFVFAIYGYLHHGFCIYGMLYGIAMTYLFSQFYYVAYVKVKKSKKEEKVN